MRKLTMLAAAMALVGMMSATPAVADEYGIIHFHLLSI